METFYIITNRLKDPDFRITREIQNYIEVHGKRCILSKKDEEGHIIPGTVPEGMDCALVLGGDGTLIRAARELGGHNIPLLGVNMGTLGYLAEVELPRIREALDMLFSGEPDIEDRMMMRGVDRRQERVYGHERHRGDPGGKPAGGAVPCICQRRAAEQLPGGRGDHFHTHGFYRV